MKLIIIIISLFVSITALSQKSSEKYFNSHCEYLFFVNDSIVDFILFQGPSGFNSKLYKGIGIYRIHNNTMSITSNKSLYNFIQIPDQLEYFNCGEIREVNTNTQIYEIKKVSTDTILLVGPILINYKKLNRKHQYFDGKLKTWPWRWSFRESHIFDPIERKMNK
jgi:hypothetical protein